MGDAILLAFVLLVMLFWALSIDKAFAIFRAMRHVGEGPRQLLDWNPYPYDIFLMSQRLLIYRILLYGPPPTGVLPEHIMRMMKRLRIYVFTLILLLTLGPFTFVVIFGGVFSFYLLAVPAGIFLLLALLALPNSGKW